MSFTIPNDSKPFELLPASTYITTCIWVIDLGTQKTIYNNQEKQLRKILIAFEVTDEKMSDGQPFLVSQDYNASMSEKANLRKMLEGWKGQKFSDDQIASFDMLSIVGKPALVNVVHNTSKDKTYANIASVARLMKGQKATPPVNPLIRFYIDEFDQEEFEKIPDYWKNKIYDSPEYNGLTTVPEESQPQNDPPEDFDDFLNG